MPSSSHWYSAAAIAQWSGSAVDWETDTIMCGLLDSSYSPAQDTDTWWSDVMADEITATGYTPGGQQLTGRSVGAVVAPHIIPLLAAPSSWPNATLTFQYAIIYKLMSTPQSSPLMGWINFGSPQTVSGGTLEIAWDSVYGVLRATAN